MPGPPPLLDRLLPTARLRRLALAAGGVVFIAIVGHAGGGSEGALGGGGRLGGDLPGFLAAARLLARQDFSSLYDPVAQAGAQADLISPDAGYVRFAYPPAVAAAYLPLLALPYRAAVLLHALVGLGLVAAAVSRLAAAFPRLSGWVLPATCAAASFYPLFRAVGGGQNTALSLFLVAGAVAASSPPVAGAWLAAWLFKPQLAVVVLGALLVARPRAALGALPVAAFGWAVNALVAGPGWVAPWWAAGSSFQAADAALEAGKSVSLVALAGGLTSAPGVLVAVAGALSLAAWSRRVRASLPDVLAVATPSALLLAPHALYYDAGLLVLPLSLLAAREGRRALPFLLGVWAFAATALVLPPGPILLAATALVLLRVAGAAGPIDTAGGRR